MALVQIRRETFVAPKLQITAMMDMFTIIIFFLLFSYSEKPEDIKLDSDLALPISAAQKEYDNTIKLFLSKSRIKLDETVVAELKADNIVDFDVDKPEDSGLYAALKEQFVTMQQKRLDAGLKNDSGKELDKKDMPHLLFFCDRDISFKIINQITQTAAMAGFPNFQFAVLEE